MSTVQSLFTPAPPDVPDYDDQITEIVGSLERRYAGDQISHADLEGRVRGFYGQFNDARIRTFVAVFVERLVRRSIDESSFEAPRLVRLARPVGAGT